MSVPAPVRVLSVICFAIENFGRNRNINIHLLMNAKHSKAFPQILKYFKQQKLTLASRFFGLFNYVFKKILLKET